MLSVLLRCLPALHSEQEELPLLAAVRPGEHVLHAQSSGWSAKVSTAHSWHSAWPVSLLALPGMHGRHDAWPSAFWWNPSGHSVQLSAPVPLARYWPLVQAVHGVPASPAGHDWQAALPLLAVFSPVPQS